ncbi:hypothetical protein WJX81_006455 [Elliptochloris bilobata]|uniref:Nuclear speckle splicing regulatory protein 1 N-terminal domain-containing protein n=1 Tax=Elliptochloris bilobata TaxID=381761 RepID=A0AAW1RIB5_9CHLO
MLTGFKGVKYGLQPGTKAKQRGLVPKPLAAFAEDDDADAAPCVGKDIARQAAKKRADAKVAQQHAAALAEDASVFDYDGVYDDIQKQRVQPKQAEKLARKPRYIEGLLDKAKEREREQDIVYERKLAKEREAEDHLFGDKDKFLTAAYKRKLEEDQKWLAEERLREAAEKRASVVSRGHMGDFYRNVLTNNAAFGTEGSKPAPAKAAASDATESAEPDSGWEAARRAREAFEEAQAAGAGLPGTIPEELVEEFLLGGLVNLTLLYFDQRHHGETVPYRWTAAVFESYAMRADVEDGFEDVAYSETALVYQALEDFPVAGQAGLVVGSIMPWAEAILFAAGLLYLGVPFGADAVVFNAHRIYGPIRLPMLTANFVVVGVITSDRVRHLNQLWADAPSISSSQPVVVLQNLRDQPCKHAS